jgi:hypothetical protein
MTITVPVPVSANRLWRKFRGRMVLNPAARVYKETVARYGARGRDAPDDRRRGANDSRLLRCAQARHREL